MDNLDIDRVINALKSVISGGKIPAALHEPCFKGNEWLYLKDCLDSTYVSYVGKYVDKFENMLADFTGAKKAVAVVNGTAALHMALRLADVSAGDEVFIPALTFVATANAVMYCGAIPHFADSETATLGMDPSKLRDHLKDIGRITSGGCRNRISGRPIKAIIPMHTFGHPVNLDALLEICREYKIHMIEDAAESLGSYYKGMHTGNHGKLSILSFNGNKTITTGGGGAIITNDEDLAKRAKHLTSTAKIPHRWEYRHDAVGFNYRLPNINAALGCAQLEQLPAFLERKRILARQYQEALQNIAGVTFFSEPTFARSNYWLNAILLNEDCGGQRENLLLKTNDQGIMTRPAWELLNSLDMYKDCPAMDLSCAKDLARRIVNIPSSPFLANENG